MKTAIKSVPMTLDAIAQAYVQKRAEIEQAETELKFFRDVLELAATQSPNRRVETVDHNVLVVNVEREVFSLSKARLALCEEMLKPFISISQYTQLRVTARK